MQKDRIRVAVIGCGSIAQYRHLPEYRNRPEVEIVAVVDKVRSRAKEVARKFDVPDHFTNYRDVMALKPDAVSVCTPTACHALHSIAFLKSKAHVLCEKPMAGSMKEARAMNAAAKANRRQLMIGHNQRLHVAHVRAKTLYQSGLLGRCLAFRTTFAHPGPETWSADKLNCHFFKKRETIWGSLADLGVHKLDLIRWLLEDDFVEVAAMYDTLEKAKCGVDDTAFAVLRTARGALGQLFSGWMYKPGSDNSTVLYCQNGRLRIEDDPQFTVIAELSNGEKHCIQTLGIQTNEAGGQFGSGVIDSFVNSIREGKNNPIPGTDVIKSLAAVVACAESGESRKFVKVPKR